MARDHYVAQVHLKRFYSPDLGELMHATRKSDLKAFTPNSQAVCRTDEGNTNDFLTEPRAIEEFLKTIESKYNGSVSLFETGKPNNDAVYVMAGFLSCLLICTPAAMRMNAALAKEQVEAMAKAADAKGAFKPPPAELGGKDLTELLDSGGIKIVVDKKMPQAVGIANILDRVAAFGNCKWEVLLNDHKDCQFFTSDFPVANEQSSNPNILNRIVPLAPYIAIRVKPDANSRGGDFTFKNFSFERKNVTRQEAIEINRLLVRSAEDTVFYRDQQAWVAPFIEKNRNYRMDTQTVNPGNGLPARYRQGVVRFDRSADAEKTTAEIIQS